MNKEEKLLNILMEDGTSDGEIINARNMLKKMDIKLSIGDNNLQRGYEDLYNRYNSLIKEYYNAKMQCSNNTMEHIYKKYYEEASKRLIDKESEISSYKFYLKIMSVFCVIMFLILLFV